ncbi:hypothetical protein [Rhodococcoides yunnanense]|jgi:hypothetical protein|uniref:hypothetical protein n=1 Tax=Rhodococcoides yunnanense TaxID=278209 RepID=UPI0022B0ACFE|nr:hypothetical protein [Rhodococcus yunnanensis]MCZ4275135.1 hypothetical protein [Rhodococcus yunnanensis]
MFLPVYSSTPTVTTDTGSAGNSTSGERTASGNATGGFSLYQSGTALFSDGTTGYESSCDTHQAPVEKVLWYCDYPETADYTDGTSSGADPACIHDDEPGNPGGGYPYIASEDRNGDGVINGYERCGLACGEEPTSGDIQTQYGCEEGYITGELCDRYN